MIEINNLTTAEIDEKFLKRVAQKVLEVKRPAFANLPTSKAGASAGEAGDVSVVLAGPARIRALNKKYRGKNRVTDVLAFSGKEQKGTSKFITPKKFQKFLGEIFICLPQAKKQAKKLGHSLKHELTLLLVHGILHLVGYEDEGSENEREKMREMEEKIMKKLVG